ncbi:MAG: VanW family protein [Chloroflexota bacterium]
MKAIGSLTYNNQRQLFQQALTALLFSFVFTLVLALILIIGYQIWFAGRIFPGVQVTGIPVGGLSTAQAAEKIAAGITFPEQGRIVLQDKEKLWVASPQELGLFLDPGASAALAFRVGREGGLFHRLGDQFLAWYSGKDTSPVLLFDQRIAFAYLTRIAAEINRPVIEANLGLQGEEVIVRSGEIGRTLDIEASLALVSAQVQSLQEGVVPLVVKETPPIILDASQQAELARRILSQPLTLTMPEGQTAAGSPWVLDRTTLASMLTIERVRNQNGEQYEVTLNSEMLINFLSNLAPQLQTYPQNARFIFNDETRQLDLLQPAVIGRTLNVEATLRAIQEGLKQDQHTIPLVFDYTNPAVTDDATAESLGITELVSQHTSYFYGSSRERVQNIQAAASRFHGLLVPPGATFSMADALGNISLDNGYAEALIIVGGQTIKGVGGGVCQVSTTLFRTAFFGGYPIVERHAHAYRVSYYEKTYGNRLDPSLAGLDATVYVPIVDFKFTNDTPYWLLMETYVNPEASTLTWKFYSTSDGRTVEWETTGPVNIVDPPEPLYKENPELAEGEIKQVDWEAKGAEVTVTRTVYRNGEVYFTDQIYTHYQPWQAVYEYGPGTEIPTPEAEEGEED